MLHQGCLYHSVVVLRNTPSSYLFHMEQVGTGGFFTNNVLPGNPLPKHIMKRTCNAGKTKHRYR